MSIFSSESFCSLQRVVSVLFPFCAGDRIDFCSVCANSVGFFGMHVCLVIDMIFIELL